MTPVALNTSARPSRFGGLDGLRAIAVAMVLWYHFFPSTLPGGFLGVDVFFAISGFLITSLLLREYDAHGKIRLVAFWRRRARRLLPALGLVLLISTALALLVGGDLLVSIGKQLLGATFFISNWVFISEGSNYFARDTPELFRNTWSLSIEEQFYIVLPLLILVIARLRRRSSRALPLLILAAVSATLMAQLSIAGIDSTRVYFGSDTHTFGLLFGAALAALVHPPQRSPRNTVRATTTAAPLGFRSQLGLSLLALSGLAVLGWQALTLAEGSAASFQGGFQLATAASLAVVWAVTRDGAWAGRALDVRPLRWVGERSYGIYLWHWPLLLILDASLGRLAPWAVAPAALALTVALAAVSYRYVEQPVRAFGLRRSLRLVTRPMSFTPRRRAVAFGLAAVLLVTLPAAGIAVATAPQQSSAAEAIARGQRALGHETAEAPGRGASSALPEDVSGEGSGSEQKLDSGSAGPGEQEGSGSLQPKTPPQNVEGQDISAVGDSVMLASLPELESAFPGIAVDAEVSRGMGVGAGIATDLSSSGELRRVLLVGLGTNGPVDVGDLEAIRSAAGKRPVVLVNAHAERDWIPGVNETLTSFADAHRGVVVADWDGSVAGVPDALAGDEIHPNPSGGEIYASSVQDALEQLQQPGEGVGYELPRR